MCTRFYRLQRFHLRTAAVCLSLLAVASGWSDGQPLQQPPALRYRWLFVWRDMNDPKEVDRVIARMPAAEAVGYNGVALSGIVAQERAPALREAAKKHHMDLIAIVMGGFHDRNYAEGLAVKDALFVARAGQATLQQDNPTRITNGDFEDVSGNHFRG